MLKKLKLGNPLHLLLDLLRNLKVFQQILAIILIMIICLLIQGFTEVSHINTMQQVSQKIFSDSVQYHEIIAIIKSSFSHVQMGYTRVLVGEDSMVPLEELDVIRTQLPYLNDLDSDFATQLAAEVEVIDATLQKPVSKENYRDLEKSLALIEGYIKPLEAKVKDLAVNSVAVGEKFSFNSKRDTLILLILSALITIGIGLAIAASVSKPLKAIAGAAKSLAAGDLSTKITAQGCMEVTATINDLNLAIESLNQLVKGINQQADNLHIASRELRSAATESAKSAGEVSLVMQELAKGSCEQSTHLENTIHVIHELIELVNKSSSETEQIARSSEQVTQSAKLGQQVTTEVAGEIEELYKSTAEVAGVIDELNKTSSEINDITSMIESIAEQTTLLALNAAIEAARAKEHGAGFSVVAKETTKLADQSKQAAQLIASLIQQMEVSTGHAVEVIQKEMKRVEAGKNLTFKASVTFEDIFKVLENVLTQIQTVAGSARAMTQSNEHVTQAITAVAAISEESTASTEEVSAIAEEQSASSEEVTALAENLAAIAADLKQAIAVFKI